MRGFSCVRVVLVATVLALSLSDGAAAVEVKIGAETITVPSPQGFSEISEVSPDIFKMWAEMLPTDNRLLAGFVSQSDVGHLLRGEAAVFHEYLLVSMAKGLDSQNWSRDQFIAFKDLVRQEQEAPLRGKQGHLDKVVENAEQALSKRLDAEAALKMKRVVPLGIDSETPSSITMSQLAKYDIAIDDTHTANVTAGTSTFLLVKGKVLFLHVYRAYKDEADLQWTRDQSQSWLKAILTANETKWPLASGGIVPHGTIVTSTTQELLSGEWAEYFLKSHPKSHGLNVSLKYPKSWIAEEGIRPHIVQIFKGPMTAGLSPYCMVFVQEPSVWVAPFLRSNIADETLVENLKAMVPDGGTYINGGQTKLDGEPCKWLKYYYDGERAGVHVRIFNLQYAVMYEDKMLALQCAVAGVADDEVLSDAFDSYLPVFQMIGNSVVIHDKWSKQPGGSFGSLMESTFGEYWLVKLAILGSLTLGMGFALPLALRFAILRHPISKGSTLIYVLNFLLFNIPLTFLMTAEGQLAACASVLAMSFIPYGILRKSADTYEREWARRRREASDQPGQGKSPPVNTIDQLLENEASNEPTAQGDERYMPPEMRSKKSDETGAAEGHQDTSEESATEAVDEKYMPPEIRTRLAPSNPTAPTVVPRTPPSPDLSTTECALSNGNTTTEDGIPVTHFREKGLAMKIKKAIVCIAILVAICAFANFMGRQVGRQAGRRAYESDAPNSLLKPSASTPAPSQSDQFAQCFTDSVAINEIGDITQYTSEISGEGIYNRKHSLICSGFFW